MRIAVLMGGGTSEHEISLLTGNAVAGALEERGHEVQRVTLEDFADLQPDSIDAEVVFVALHGGAGEDGRVQAELERAGVAYVGSRPGPCAVAMDKVQTKQVARQVDVLVTDEVVFEFPCDAANVLAAADRLGPATVLKPVGEGSAVGVFVCMTPDDLQRVLAEQELAPGAWMLEPYIPGRELTVGVVLDEASPVIEIRPKDGFYDYTNKYTAGRTEYDCPADLPEDVAGRVASDALRIYRALHLRDMARIDFRYDPGRGHFLLEANTIPGMTATSLLPMGAKALGMDFASLCERLCKAARERGADLS
jgi:D-alanine-D-alanine ligase